MLALCSPRSAASPRNPRLARLRLEHLEERNTPSTVTLNVNYDSNKTISLYGEIDNVTTLEGHTVTFSGQATGTATTESNGAFLLTVQATGLGQVTATVDDGGTASVTLVDEAIEISDFFAAEDMANIWTFRGYVNYCRNFDSLTVYLNGVPVTLWNQNRTTQTDSGGYFEIMVQLNGLSSDNGGVWVKAKSPWGTWSEDAHDEVSQMGT